MVSLPLAPPFHILTHVHTFCFLFGPWCLFLWPLPFTSSPMFIPSVSCLDHGVSFSGPSFSCPHPCSYLLFLVWTTISLSLAPPFHILTHVHTFCFLFWPPCFFLWPLPFISSLLFIPSHSCLDHSVSFSGPSLSHPHSCSYLLFLVWTTVFLSLALPFHVLTPVHTFCFLFGPWCLFLRPFPFTSSPLFIPSVSCLDHHVCFPGPSLSSAHPCSYLLFLVWTTVSLSLAPPFHVLTHVHTFCFLFGPWGLFLWPLPFTSSLMFIPSVSCLDHGVSFSPFLVLTPVHTFCFLFGPPCLFLWPLPFTSSLMFIPSVSCLDHSVSFSGPSLLHPPPCSYLLFLVWTTMSLSLAPPFLILTHVHTFCFLFGPQCLFLWPLPFMSSFLFIPSVSCLDHHVSFSSPSLSHPHPCSYLLFLVWTTVSLSLAPPFLVRPHPSSYLLFLV